MTRRVRVRLADLTPAHIGTHIQIRFADQVINAVLSDYEHHKGWTQLFLGGMHVQITGDATALVITDK